MRYARITLVPLALVAVGLASLGLVPAGASIQPFPDQIDLPAGWAPEGITAGRGTTVYVGSLAGGGIWEGDVRTGPPSRIRDDEVVEKAGGELVGRPIRS
jgi:hypothetical protein